MTPVVMKKKHIPQGARSLDAGEPVFSYPKKNGRLLLLPLLIEDKLFFLANSLIVGFADVLKSTATIYFPIVSNL